MLSDSVVRYGDTLDRHQARTAGRSHPARASVAAADPPGPHRPGYLRVKVGRRLVRSVRSPSRTPSTRCRNRRGAGGPRVGPPRIVKGAATPRSSRRASWRVWPTRDRGLFRRRARRNTPSRGEARERGVLPKAGAGPREPEPARDARASAQRLAASPRSTSSGRPGESTRGSGGHSTLVYASRKPMPATTPRIRGSIAGDVGHPHRDQRRSDGERLAHPAFIDPKAGSSSSRPAATGPGGRAPLRHVRGRVHPRGRPLHVRGALRASRSTTPGSRHRRGRPRPRSQGRQVRPPEAPGIDLVAGIAPPTATTRCGSRARGAVRRPLRVPLKRRRTGGTEK